MAKITAVIGSGNFETTLDNEIITVTRNAFEVVSGYNKWQVFRLPISLSLDTSYRIKLSVIANVSLRLKFFAFDDVNKHDFQVISTESLRPNVETRITIPLNYVNSEWNSLGISASDMPTPGLASLVIKSFDIFPLIKHGTNSYGWDKLALHSAKLSDTEVLEVGNYSSIALSGSRLIVRQHDTRSATMYPFKEITESWPIANQIKQNWDVENISSGHEYPGKTVIGHDVWIGTDVTIMGGLTIGNGAVIGSGAIVTHDVPPYAIVVGNPARVLKYRFEPEIVTALQKIAWWHWEESVINERLRDIVDGDIIKFVQKYHS